MLTFHKQLELHCYYTCKYNQLFTHSPKMSKILNKYKLTQLLFNRFKGRPYAVTNILRKKATTIQCHTPVILRGINQSVSPYCMY